MSNMNNIELNSRVFETLKMNPKDNVICNNEYDISDYMDFDSCESESDCESECNSEIDFFVFTEDDKNKMWNDDDYFPSRKFTIPSVLFVEEVIAVKPKVEEQEILIDIETEKQRIELLKRQSDSISRMHDLCIQWQQEGKTLVGNSLEEKYENIIAEKLRLAGLKTNVQTVQPVQRQRYKNKPKYTSPNQQGKKQGTKQVKSNQVKTDEVKSNEVKTDEARQSIILAHKKISYGVTQIVSESQDSVQEEEYDISLYNKQSKLFKIEDKKKNIHEQWLKAQEQKRLREQREREEKARREQQEREEKARLEALQKQKEEKERLLRIEQENYAKGKNYMCNQYMEGYCRYHNHCHFAHDPNELNLLSCKFGTDCKYIIFKDNSYINTSDDYVCNRLHTNETKLNYAIRMGYNPNLKRKIPICSFVAQGYKCKYGNNCKFSHEIQKPKQHQTQVKPVVQKPTVAAPWFAK